jgi:hypothetical protein
LRNLFETMRERFEPARDAILEQVCGG